MKARFKYLLQKVLGFGNYLFIFSLFKIRTLNRDGNEKDFLYFLKLIPPGGIILDIGANIGIMTVHLARGVKNSTVLAFEPVPYNLRALHRVIAFYKLSNVRVFGCALGNSNGTAEIVMPVMDRVKMQGLSHIVHQSIPENNEGEKFTTEVKKLDAMDEVMNGKARVTAVKMDVENFEYFVLDGAREMLRKYKPLIYCELWDNENRRKCFELLHSLGYEAKILVAGSLAACTKEALMEHPTQNFFFL